MMKINLFLTVIFLFIVNACYASPLNLKPISLYNGAITLNIPNTFEPLKEHDETSKYSESVTKQKFAHWNKPKYVFVDSNYNNVIIDFQQKHLTYDEMPQDLENFANGFKKSFPFAAIHDKKIITVNGKKFAMLKITAPANDSNAIIQSMIFYTTADKRKLTFTINLNDHDYPNGDKIFQRIITSVKIST